MDLKKSIKWNTSANFIGLFYTTIISIAVYPLYLKYLGAEAFGLVGFFTMLQAWLQLLDMGMSPMLSRQAAKAHGHNIDYTELIKLLRSLELIVLVLALMVGILIYLFSNWIANNWLNVLSLDLTKVAISIVLMGVMIGLGLFASLYRGGIRGLENQVWLNIANIIIVTLKFAGAFLLIRFVTQEFVYFFVYQLIVTIIELIILANMFHHFIPSTDKVKIRFFWSTLKPIIPFAAGIAYTTGIWIILTQLDKIILSKILTLSEYGYFALVVTVVAGINRISGPISQAILPRMTYLLSQGKMQDMLILYRKSTQIMAVIMLPLTGIIALFSTELMFAWTGDRTVADWTGPILFWFALGNGILAISAFQYYLQFAHGKLKMHVIYHSITAVVQIPLIIFVAFKYEALGVAITWFILRLIIFTIWTPIVHHKFAPGIHLSWIFKDVAPIFVSSAVALFLINSININFLGMSRGETFLVLIGFGLLILILNLFVSSTGRGLILSTKTLKIFT